MSGQPVQGLRRHFAPPWRLHLRPRRYGPLLRTADRSTTIPAPQADAGGGHKVEALSGLVAHLANDPETSRLARDGLLATLRSVGAPAVLKRWAPGKPGAPWVAKFKRRSFETALQHIEELESMEPPRCLVLGDSITERMRTHFGGEYARRLGGGYIHSVGGDGVEHLLFRLLLSFEQCFAAHVRTIVLMVGINNLLGARPQHGVESEGKPVPPQEVGAAIQRLVRRLHASCAAAGNEGVEVVVCHVLGVSDDFGDAGTAAAVNGRVDELNASLSQGACEHSSLGACHVAPVGLPRPHRAGYYAADRLHLSAAGYEALVPQLLALVPALVPALPRMAGKRHGKRRIGQDADETSSRASSPRKAGQRVRETPTRVQ